MNARQDAIDHASTVLAILGHERDCIDPDCIDPDCTSIPARDVSPVALSFAETICDHHPEMVDELARLVRHTSRHDPLALAEALLRDIDIPDDSPAGETKGLAFAYWARGGVLADERQRQGHAVTSAHLAAEALCVWNREHGTRWLQKPTVVLLLAKNYLLDKGAVAHA